MIGYNMRSYHIISYRTLSYSTAPHHTAPHRIKALSLLPDGNMSNSSCAGCPGSDMIDSAFFTTLAPYRLSKVDNSHPTMRLATRTICGRGDFRSQLWHRCTEQRTRMSIQYKNVNTIQECQYNKRWQCLHISYF